MDTDSMYFALLYDTLEEAVKPEPKLEFKNNKKQWLSWDKWSNREPGLFKLEKEGTRTIALCSKCYFVDDEKSAKTKMSSKIREGSGWLQGHGHKQRLQDERRGNVHLRTAQAFFPISRVTSFFKAETTSGSLFTHSVDLLLLLFVCFIFISTAY